MSTVAEPPHAHLPVISEKRLPQAITFPLLAYYDRFDLLAIVTKDQDVSVFRIASGQLAFTVKSEGNEECDVTALAWKPDGDQLAVAWSNGKCELISGQNGRPEEDAPVENAENGELRPVTKLGWTRHEPHLARNPTQSGQSGGMTTDEWYDGLRHDGDDMNDDFEKPSSATLSDLVRAITTLDLTKTMPKLSDIPNHGLRLFSQILTTPTFDNFDEASKHIEVILACRDDGSVEVLQAETVKIASCNVGGRTLWHAAHPKASQHAFISHKDESGQRIDLIDLPLSTLGSPLLYVVATNAKLIQCLFEYTRRTILCIEHDYKTGTQLPIRVMNSLKEMLEEKDEGGVAFNFYHTAMTGHFNSQLLEWLVDILKETNHKRWDQAMATMYTNVQNHIFINLMPALDRLEVAATTLRGHAKFSDGMSSFDCDSELFSDILRGTTKLRRLAHDMQLIIMTEHRQFRAFSKWLRMQIDIGVSDPNSNNALETEEREIPSLDYSLILAYIKDALQSSKLVEKIPSSLAAVEIIDEAIRVMSKSITAWQSRILTPATTTLDPGCAVLDIEATPTAFKLLVLDDNANAIERITVSMPPATQITPLTPPPPTLDRSGADGFADTILSAALVPRTECWLLLFAKNIPDSDRIGELVRFPENEVLHTFTLQENFTPESLLVCGRSRKRVCVVFGNGGRAWKALDLEAQPTISKPSNLRHDDERMQESQGLNTSGAETNSGARW